MTHTDTDGRFRLPRDLPKGWKAKEIVLVQLSFRYRSGRLIFESSPIYVFDKYPSGVGSKEIKAFVTDLATSGFPTSPPSPRPDEMRRTRLDIVVRNPCYVVIYLDPDVRWQFRSSGPAITTKADYGEDNARLKHIGPAGEILSDHGPGETPCHIAYFSVLRRGYHEHQAFNFHLELIQGRRARRPADRPADWPPLEITLDPDVPDDGGGFPHSAWVSPYEDY